VKEVVQGGGGGSVCWYAVGGARRRMRTSGTSVVVPPGMRRDTCAGACDLHTDIPVLSAEAPSTAKAQALGGRFTSRACGR
jgi:hypothetical protein